MSVHAAAPLESNTAKRAKNAGDLKVPVDTGLVLAYNGNKYTFNPANLIIGDPVKKRNSLKSEISYRLKFGNGTHRDISPVELQTPLLKSTFGFSTYRHQGDARTKLSIDARFSDPESATLATLRAMDAHILKVIKERKSSFVSAKKKTNDMVDLMYNSLVKINEKDGVTYDPSISFKIVSSEQDGVIAAKVKVFTADSSKDSYEEIEVTELGKGVEYRAFVSFEGIYVTPQSITPKLRAEGIQKVRDASNTGFRFIDGETIKVEENATKDVPTDEEE